MTHLHYPDWPPTKQSNEWPRIIYIAQKDPLFGEVLPSAEEIAHALADKEKIKIKPAGAQAMHKLGPTTQVPTKLAHLTDGNSRTITIKRM